MPKIERNFRLVKKIKPNTFEHVCACMAAFDCFMSGQSVDHIAASAKVSEATAWDWINTVIKSKGDFEPEHYREIALKSQAARYESLRIKWQQEYDRVRDVTVPFCALQMTLDIDVAALTFSRMAVRAANWLLQDSDGVYLTPAQRVGDEPLYGSGDQNA